MANVFLVPGFLKNIRRSVLEGVQKSELDLESDPSLADIITREYGTFPVKLWAVKETKKLVSLWKKCANGDLFLFYHGGKFLYVGEVLFKYPFVESRSQVDVGAKLAEKVWSKDVDGKTWPYLVFLTNVREIDFPLAKFNEMTGYRFSAVGGFMRVREEKRAQILIDFLLQVKPPKIIKEGVEMEHDQVVEIIYDLGGIIGYKPLKKWRHEGYEFDVVWNKPPAVGPRCVFEVQFKGSPEAALTRLKHAHDLWPGSQLFFITTENQIKKIEMKYLAGAFHELKEEGVLTLVRLEEVKQFYEFKGKFEWLERKFGLKPRG